MLQRVCALFAALCLLASAAPGVADPQNPMQFYPRDYVVQPGKEAEKAIERPHKAPPTIRETPRGLEGAHALPAIEHHTAQVPNVMEELAGVKINAMSLIVSPHDPQHFRTHVQDLIDVAEKFAIPVRSVYIIGNARGLLQKVPPSSIRNRKLAGVFRYLPAMPKPFTDVTTSPAFVLESPEGAILLEGSRSIAQHFNSRGEFIEPNRAVPDISAAEAALPNPVPLPAVTSAAP